MCAGALDAVPLAAALALPHRIDYELRHHDLTVTISEDAFASLYKLRDTNILDHSPEVLGLEEV